MAPLPSHLLGNLVEGRDERGEDGLTPLLVELDDLLGPLGNSIRGQAKLGVDLVVWARSTPCGETKVLVRESAPAVRRVCLDRHDGCARGEDRELVLGVLGVLRRGQRQSSLRLVM